MYLAKWAWVIDSVLALLLGVIWVCKVRKRVGLNGHLTFSDVSKILPMNKGTSLGMQSDFGKKITPEPVLTHLTNIPGQEYGEHG